MIEKMKKLNLISSRNDAHEIAKMLANLGFFMDMRTDSLSEHQKIEIGDLGKKFEKLKQIAKKQVETNEKPISKEELLGSLQALENLEIEKRTKEKIRFEMQKSLDYFGNCDNQKFLELEKAGLKIFPRLLNEKDSIDTGELVFTAPKNKEGKAVLIFSFEERDFPGIPIVFMPSNEATRAELDAEIKELNKKIATIHEYIQAHEMVARTALNSIEDDALLETMVAGTASRFQEKIELAVFSGFYPEKEESKLSEFLKKSQSEGLVFVCEMEKVHHDEEAPVALKNKWFNRIFEPVTRIFSLPGYHEFDPTPLLAPFFLFFVGMCLADLGYGLIFLLMGVVARLLVKKPGQKDIADLIIVLGLGMVVLGIIFNVIVGYKIIGNHEVPGIWEQGHAPNLINSLVLFPHENEIMGFSLILGFVQMLFGIFYRAMHHTRQHGIEHGLHSFGHFFIMLAVALIAAQSAEKGSMIGPIPLGDWSHAWDGLPVLANILLIVGIALVLFFTNLKMNFFLRPLGGLWAMYEIITGILSDTLSYVRLFALGLAGGLLGLAMNQVAITASGDGGVIGVIIMILILLIGHGVNFGLALLGSFVHPVRLTLVEFYKALGFKGGGIPFTPVSLKSQIKTIKS